VDEEKYIILGGRHKPNCPSSAEITGGHLLVHTHDENLDPLCCIVKSKQKQKHRKIKTCRGIYNLH
jgi:hypothetical protein